LIAQQANRNLSYRQKDSIVRLILAWIINAVALFVLPYVFPWVRIDDPMAAIIAALVLGLINTLIRPILVLLTLPVTLLTLGLFIFIINGLLFWAVAHWVNGFHVTGFWAAVFGAIVYSIISWALSSILLKKR
jgi:putative membrane protein